MTDSSYPEVVITRTNPGTQDLFTGHNGTSTRFSQGIPDSQAKKKG